jgi:hypothetical protein
VYNGVSIGEHARVLGRYVSTKANDSAVSRLTDAVATGVAPDPTLAEREPRVSWTAALLHVGAEGINSNLGNLSSADALGLLHDFVTDAVSVAVANKVRGGRVEFVARVEPWRPDLRVAMGLRRRITGRENDKRACHARLLARHLHRIGRGCRRTDAFGCRDDERPHSQEVARASVADRPASHGSSSTRPRGDTRGASRGCSDLDGRQQFGGSGRLARS